MTVERIFTRSTRGGPQVEHTSVQVVAKAGIVGDRYFGRDDEPGQNITFIEAEEIESFADEYQRQQDLAVTGRNVVTRGIRLNELVGREFHVGALRFRGVELCEPCSLLGQALSSENLTSTQVVKRLVHKAGLRADALSSGKLEVGAAFRLAA